jgi:hypothetical protein
MTITTDENTSQLTLMDGTGKMRGDPNLFFHPGSV